MYITLDEVKAQYPSLAESITRGTVLASRAEQWIEDSESLINGYVSQRYTIPFTINPPLIISLAYGFFDYYYQKDIHTPSSSGDEVKWLYPRYDRLIAVLELIQSGELLLLDTANTVISASADRLKKIESNHREVDQIFSMKESWNQSVDSDYAEEPS